MFNNISSFKYTSIFHSHNGILCETEGTLRLCFMHYCVPNKVAINQKGKNKK